MKNIPGHFSPTYTQASREDALFHYTTAAGLYGIFGSGEMWSTAYYCANDESELEAGKGVIEPLFRKETHKLIEERDPRVRVFVKRGTDIRDGVDNFEDRIISSALNVLCAYITCFCKPSGKEDFSHGLLSQWRGYGNDGGYALQFSREKLLAAIDGANKTGKLNYDLQDIYYAADNPLKDQVFKYKEAFVNSYLTHLNEITRPIAELLAKKTMPNPIAGLLNGPLEALLDYLVQTKNAHFSEERECRLSLIQLVQPCEGCLPVEYFNRNGLLVPYIKTPVSVFNILDCVEWVVIGPGPRLEARMKSVSQLIKQFGKDIKIRPSHIPYTRL
jgi:hypothetical protein